MEGLSYYTSFKSSFQWLLTPHHENVFLLLKGQCTIYICRSQRLNNIYTLPRGVLLPKCRVFFSIRTSVPPQFLPSAEPRKNLQIHGLRTWKVVSFEKVGWFGHLGSLLSTLKFLHKGIVSKYFFIIFII